MAMSKWVPTTNLMMLRRMGKLAEELGELLIVASRCIIQGIDEVDPGSGEINRDRLTNEIADVLAQIECTTEALGLDREYISARKARKEGYMREWEAMFGPADDVAPKSELAAFFATQERDQARAAAVALRTHVANAIAQYEDDGDIDELINNLKESE